MKEPSVLVRIKGNATELSKTLNTVQARLNRVGGGMKKVGRGIAMSVGLPLMLVGGLGLNMAANFEQSMVKLQSLTQASKGQFSEMRETALKLGSSTKFSATETANAMGVLSQAGFDVNQIMKATPGILQLASAGDLELAEAADIASNILRGYKMQVEDLNRVNDVLAFTANATNSSVQDLGEAFTYAGPVAAGMGIKFEEAAGALGLMANAGFKGTLSGTALRGALTSLAVPAQAAIDVFNRLGIRKASVLDSKGNVKSLVGIIKELERAGATTSDLMVIFGERAGPGMAALVSQGSKALEDFTAKVGGSTGEAARVAGEKMHGFNAGLKKVRASLEALAIKIGDSGILDMLTDFLGKVAGLVGKLQDLNPEMLKWAVYIGGALIAVGPFLIGLGSMIKAVGLLCSAFKLIPLALTAIMAHPIIAGITAFIAGLMWVSGYLKKHESASNTGTNLTPGAPDLAGAAYGRMGIKSGAADFGSSIVQANGKKYFGDGAVKVDVNFSNVPKGTRVNTVSSGSVDLFANTGYALGGAH